MSDSTARQDVRPTGLAKTALALWAQSEGRRLAVDLDRAGFPVLLLKGPELQARLYGTPAAYASGDLDVLVRGSDAARVRRFLERRGWTFERGNGVLWRASRAATYVRDGFRLDLHWGLHAAHLPAWTLRHLEHALWQRAEIGPSGMYEPDAESLFVYLAVHAAGHRHERQEWTDNVTASMLLVSDWSRVEAIARSARVSGVVKDAISGSTRRSWSLLDGITGWLISFGTWIARAHFLPPSLRERVGEAMTRRREGYGLVARFGATVERFAGLDLSVPRGVFSPRNVSEQLVTSCIGSIEDRVRPQVVEVGTGTGAVALAIALRRPDAIIHATDISFRAVAAAKRNARRIAATNIHVVRGDLLSPLPDELLGNVTAVISNIPYVPDRIALRNDWNAPMSTVAGPDADGLGYCRDIAREARRFLTPGGWLILQLIRWQWTDFARELAAMGYEPGVVDESIDANQAVVVASRLRSEMA